MREIKIKTPTIRLDQLLKWAGLVASGGEAKGLIQGGKVLVNDQEETRRSVKISPGDIVEIKRGVKFVVGRES